KWIVIITVLICLAFGGYKTYKHYISYVPTYTSNVTIRINSMKSVQDDKNKTNASSSDDTNDGTDSDRKMTEAEKAQKEQERLNRIYSAYSGSAAAANQNIATSYLGLATSQDVKKNIAALTGLRVSQIGTISAVQSEDIPQFVKMVATSSSPEVAKQVATALPEAYNNELKRIINLDCVEVVYEASEASLIPRSRDLTLLKAFAVGIVIAIFLVLLAEVLDTKIKTPEDVEKYWGLPLIGTIPMDDGKSKGRHVIQK
ncbi:YveK family protein, partial [Intestinibacter sp.]